MCLNMSQSPREGHHPVFPNAQNLCALSQNAKNQHEMQLSHHRDSLSNLAYTETVAWYFWLFGGVWSQRDIKLSNNIPQALENDDIWGDTLRGPKIFLALYCLERSKGNWPQSRQSPKLFLKSSEVGLPQPLTRWRVCHPPGSGGKGQGGY
jgi:hypothetical protein